MSGLRTQDSAAPPTSVLGNRIEPPHHFFQSHLFISQPKPHPPTPVTLCCRRRLMGGVVRWGGGTAAPPFPGLVPEPRQGGAPCGRGAAGRKRKRCACLACPHGHQGALRVRPRLHLGAPRVRPRGHLGALRVHPRGHLEPMCGPPTDTWRHPPQYRVCSPRKDAARPHPSQPWVSAPSPERKEELPGRAEGEVAARASPGTCFPHFTSGCPGAGAEAAAAQRVLPELPAPPHASQPPRVPGSTMCPRVARVEQPPPKSRRRSEDAGRREGGARQLAQAFQPRHAWHQATACILHLSALHIGVAVWAAAAAREQGCGLTLSSRRVCQPSVVGMPGGAPLPTEAGFQEEAPVCVTGLVCSSEEPLRLRPWLLSTLGHTVRLQAGSQGQMVGGDPALALGEVVGLGGKRHLESAAERDEGCCPCALLFLFTSEPPATSEGGGSKVSRRAGSEPFFPLWALVLGCPARSCARHTPLHPPSHTPSPPITHLPHLTLPFAPHHTPL